MKRYQIGRGKYAWFWESNIVKDKKIVPLRMIETKPDEHCLGTRKRIFCLESLSEHISPPHEIDACIFFTEEQAKDIIRKLEELVKEKR